MRTAKNENFASRVTAEKMIKMSVDFGLVADKNVEKAQERIMRAADSRCIVKETDEQNLQTTRIVDILERGRATYIASHRKYLDHEFDKLKYVCIQKLS